MVETFQKTVQLVLEHEDGFAVLFAVAFMRIGDGKETVSPRGLAELKSVFAVSKLKGFFVETLGFPLGCGFGLLGAHVIRPFKMHIPAFKGGGIQDNLLRYSLVGIKL